MPLSELDQPLGRNRRARLRPPVGRWLSLGLAGTLVVAFTTLTLYAALRRDPDGGEPMATAAIREKAPAPEIAASIPESGRLDEARGPASARQLETESGVTVVRPGSDVPGAIVITVPDEGAIKLAPAPDKRLVERTRHGFLPKVGPDGATPAQVYARPLGPAPAAKPAGRIAILVGGLGISQSSTSEAIARLPGAVSLAFAPYGADLEKTAARARAEGHEVFLQVPMEPFDYPDNDPGPHTLLVGQKGADNLDRLQWALGRFTGYVGIVNFLGGRLTADDAALTPLLRELAGRGLMVVDDGSSPRSQLAPAAARAQIPALKADLAIDGTPRADAIDKELQRLETLAREHGVAVATASALPVTVERITRWARTLEAKGLAIVPVSAARGFRNPSSTGSLR
ncbi:divergent polysaccharide deacetylase family protein [Bosea sp. (in: a-proteobacteria)]|uniref:divergent polysaccharide deacetylase family protein n=1 Tax=Bosea sp. (in: a-proteobacteria) TaxID=1871050 RepID=UPI002FC6611B